MKILKHIYIVGFLALMLASCEKEYASIEETDEKTISEYLQRNNLNFQKIPGSDIYYQVIAKGEGAQPQDTSKLFFTYTVSTLNGNVKLDNERTNRYTSFMGYLTSGSTRSGNLIYKAWYEALKAGLVNRGGTIRLIIPSRLAYGRNGHTITSDGKKHEIPANEPIDCTLKLYNVYNQRDFEDVFVERFMAEKGLTGFQETPSGLHYKIIEPGSGTEIVDEFSTLTVGYTGRHADGTVFETVDSYKFSFSDPQKPISGWQEGVPLLNKGGKIRLIIPPSLGYGATGSGREIKGNEILDFDIELKEVVNEE